MTSAKNFVLMASLHRDFGALRESVWRPTLVEGARPVVKKFNEHSPRLFRNANKALKTIPTMLNRPAQDLGAPGRDPTIGWCPLQTPWFASKSIGTIGLRPQL